jgi:hypothetical protein
MGRHHKRRREKKQKKEDDDIIIVQSNDEAYALIEKFMVLSKQVGPKSDADALRTWNKIFRSPVQSSTSATLYVGDLRMKGLELFKYFVLEGDIIATVSHLHFLMRRMFMTCAHEKCRPFMELALARFLSTYDFLTKDGQPILSTVKHNVELDESDLSDAYDWLKRFMKMTRSSKVQKSKAAKALDFYAHKRNVKYMTRNPLFIEINDFSVFDDVEGSEDEDDDGCETLDSDDDESTEESEEEESEEESEDEMPKKKKSKKRPEDDPNNMANYH